MQSQSTWTFISVPDMFNSDYADLSGGADPEIAALFSESYSDGLVQSKNWAETGINSMNADLAAVWLQNLQMMKDSAGSNPDLTIVAGDLIYGRFPQFADNLKQAFGEESTTLSEDIDAALEIYYTWIRKLWSEVGVSTFLPAIGDHEIADNLWNTGGVAAQFIPQMKEAFGTYFIDPLGLGPTWNGVSTFAPEGLGQYDEGSYVKQNKNVLFLTVDVFEFEGANIRVNPNRDQASTANFTGEHLEWVREVLAAAKADDSVDHIIVQGHTPILGPVNAQRSSRMTFDNAENSEFWQLLSEFGPEAGGKVRLYVSGEVHATTGILDADSGIAQVSHGTVSRAHGGQIDPTYIVFEVDEDRIVGREFLIKNDVSPDKRNTVFEVDTPVSVTVDKVTSGAIETGRVEIDLSNGVSFHGSLEAPFATRGHLTYVGGPEDDVHRAGGGPGGWTHNILYGHGGDDHLDGYLGRDVLYGGDGDDRLIGGGANDTVTGGAGADVFVSNSFENRVDTILDFAFGEDLLEFGLGRFTDLTVTDNGEDLDVLTSEGLGFKLAGKAGSALTHQDVRLVVEFGGSSYQAGTPGLTWEEAKAEAEALGGKLLEIDSAEENAFIMETFWDGNSIWLGLNDVAQEGVWRNADGEIASYLNWMPGQPNGVTRAGWSAQDYGRLSSPDGRWGDAHNESAAVIENGRWTPGEQRTVIEFEHQLILQSGTETTLQSSFNQWHTVTFDQAMADPVVVMGPVSFNDTDPVHARVRNVTSDGFEYQLEEWLYAAVARGGMHGEETVSWLAVERGQHKLDDGAVIEAGVVRTDHQWADVRFDANFGSANPIVLGQIASEAGRDPATHRFQDIDKKGFSVRVQEEEGRDGRHLVEDVNWVAFRHGEYNDFSAGRDVGDEDAFDIAVPMRDAGSTLADIQTFNGSDTAQLRWLGQTDATISVFVEEERSRDEETNHLDEDIGWVLTDQSIWL